MRDVPTMIICIQEIVIVLCVVHLICAKQQVIIRNNHKLKQLGFNEDVNLGEVVAEQVVDSPAECGNLCNESLACGSVMLMGRLCRMFAPVKCEATHRVSCAIFTSILYVVNGSMGQCVCCV